MPELPEVEVFKQQIDRTSLNKKISDIYVEREDILEEISPDEFVNTLTGDQFVSTSRHGKYLIVESRKGTTVFMHFGMTARPVFYTDKADKPEYPRLICTFDTDEHLAFDCLRMLGKLGITESKEHFIEEKDLGIDAMHPKLNKQAFWSLITSGRGYVKTTLMQQSTIAGIGNEMSDEILFQAGLHTKSKIGGLNSDDLDRIYETMRRVFGERIETEAQTDLLPDNWLLKHRNDGDECPNCGGDIKQVKISGRSSYVCEHCQELKT